VRLADLGVNPAVQANGFAPVFEAVTYLLIALVRRVTVVKVPRRRMVRWRAEFGEALPPRPPSLTDVLDPVQECSGMVFHPLQFRTQELCAFARECDTDDGHDVPVLVVYR
jgi:hypothetical protein